MELTKIDVLKGNYKFPNHLVKLDYTKHFLERLQERGLGIECIPTMVRVTRNNIHSARTFDGTHLSSVVVKLDYNYSKDLYLCFNPYDGGTKTLWFREKKKHGYFNRQRHRKTNQ